MPTVRKIRYRASAIALCIPNAIRPQFHRPFREIPLVETALTAPAPPVRWTHRLEALGFRGLEGLITGLGPERAASVSAAIWRRIAPLNARHGRALGHIRESLPELGDGALPPLLDAMWDNLGRTFAEAFHIGALVADQDRFRIGDDTRDAVMRAKREGAVFVSLHQGNWELAAPVLDRLGLPVGGVYQRVQNPLVDQRATASRLPFYKLGLFTKRSDSARQIMKLVSDGGTIAIMADLRDVGGVTVPFFGRPAPSNIFPAFLARTRGVPLFAGVVLRESGSTFRVKVVEIPVQRSDDKQADIAAITANIQRCFEAFIRERPGQWMWAHKRWER